MYELFAAVLMHPAEGPTLVLEFNEAMYGKRHGMIPDGVEPDLDTNKDLMEKIRR